MPRAVFVQWLRLAGRVLKGERSKLDESIWLWVGFLVFVLAMLAIDLGVFHREAHTVSVKEAGIWTVVWISLAMLFAGGIYFFWDNLVPTSDYTNSEATLTFLTAYVIEKALSVDNIFVFVLVFTYFAVPGAYQHRVLFWGVLGALVMRAVMILAGAALIERFDWILYIFGAFLVYTGIKMATSKHEEVDPGANPIVKWVRKVMPVTDHYEGQNFFVRHNGVLMATPLLLVLIVVETTDLVFAVDSIPAIFAVTQDAFIVFTSNVFAILGLRSLYFLLAGVMDKFRYLSLGLAVVLTFVGVKMLVHSWVHIPTAVSLSIILGVIAISVAASLLIPEKDAHEKQAHLPSSAEH
jgi:tellurite resistance protein TerC